MSTFILQVQVRRFFSISIALVLYSVSLLAGKQKMTARLPFADAPCPHLSSLAFFRMIARMGFRPGFFLQIFTLMNNFTHFLFILSKRDPPLFIKVKSSFFFPPQIAVFYPCIQKNS